MSASVTPIHQPGRFQRPSLDLLTALSSDPPPIDYVLPGMVAGTVGGLIAAGAAGKTWVGLQISIQIAGGPDTLCLGDLPTGQVVYVAAEDPPITLLHRLRAIGREMDQQTRETVVDRLTIQPAVGDHIVITTPTWRDSICRLAEGARLLVLDTLRRCHEGDENSSTEMADLVGALETVALKTGASVLFLHHSNKAAALAGSGDMQQAGRGSSVLTDNTRWQAFLQGMTWSEAKERGISDEERKIYVRLGICKQNYGPPWGSRWYRRTSAGLVPTVLPEKPLPRREGGGWHREF